MLNSTLPVYNSLTTVFKIFRPLAAIVTVHFLISSPSDKSRFTGLCSWLLPKLAYTLHKGAQLAKMSSSRPPPFLLDDTRR